MEGLIFLEETLLGENVVLVGKSLGFPFLEWVIVRDFPIEGASTVLPNTGPSPSLGSSVEKLHVSSLVSTANTKAGLVQHHALCRIPCRL